MKNPFIPDGEPNLVIISGEASEEVISKLRELRLDIVKTIKHPNLNPSISFHPDMFIHPINHNSLVIEPLVYDYYKDLLSGYKLKLIRGSKKIGQRYPENIPYNVARIKDYYIHNCKYTDESIRNHYRDKNIGPINIRQGYSKCSLAVVGEDHIITSDKPSYNILESMGFNPLLISPGNIQLEGMNYGFIGGCIGALNNETILLSGSLSYHPDKELIRAYLDDLNKSIIELYSGPLVDLGSILCFKG